MGSDIDYRTLPVPEDKPWPEFTYAERRSQLYDLIEQAGHPRNLERTQAELGRRFGVSQRQISKDIERIRQFEQDRIGDNAATNTQFICRKAVRELMSQGDYEAAAKLQLDYNKWLQDTGEQEREPEKREHSFEESFLSGLHAATTDEQE